MMLECLVCGATLESHAIKSQEDITMFRLIHENHDSLATLEKETAMTAEIKVETTIYAVCAPCDIKLPADDRNGAQLWIDRHNRETHWERFVDAAVIDGKREAWDQGFSERGREWQRQLQNPAHPITRNNPYAEFENE